MAAVAAIWNLFIAAPLFSGSVNIPLSRVFFFLRIVFERAYERIIVVQCHIYLNSLFKVLLCKKQSFYFNHSGVNTYKIIILIRFESMHLRLRYANDDWSSSTAISNRMRGICRISPAKWISRKEISLVASAGALVNLIRAVKQTCIRPVGEDLVNVRTQER